jgi:hypothetical protein
MAKMARGNLNNEKISIENSSFQIFKFWAFHLIINGGP